MDVLMFINYLNALLINMKIINNNYWYDLVALFSGSEKPMTVLTN